MSRFSPLEQMKVILSKFPHFLSIPYAPTAVSRKWRFIMETTPYKPWTTATLNFTNTLHDST